MLDEDKREATMKTTESNLATFRLRTCPKLEHMYAHVQQIIVEKKTKCLSTDPFLREVFLCVLFPPFFTIFFICYYVTAPWDPKLCLPAQLTSIYYIIGVPLSVTRYDGKCICGSCFVISKPDVQEIKTTFLWNKKPFFKVNFSWNFELLSYQRPNVSVE
jgi:hypothetical protein